MLTPPSIALHKYATRESYNDSKFWATFISYACTSTVFNLNVEKNWTRISHLSFTRARHHHKMKEKKNETHELGTITKHALLHIQIYNYRLHISNVSHFEHVQYAYITHQSIGRGNATFYRINNIGHKADSWKYDADVRFAES